MPRWTFWFPVRQALEKSLLACRALNLGDGSQRLMKSLRPASPQSVAMAKAKPEQNFLGIEVHSPGVGACLASAEEEGVQNLRVMCHDAVEVLHTMIPDNSLNMVQLFFPDPWHKARHNKRRIVQPPFAELVKSKLKLGGVFHMATDWEAYAVHMLEVMSSLEGYRNQSASNDYVPRPESRPVTKFEQRGHRLGHGVWDLMFERVK